jgi:hypothetical protein
MILLLIFSGALSLFELERVGHDTEEILYQSKECTDLAHEIVTVLNEQNDLMIEMAVIGGKFTDINPHYNNCLASIDRLSIAAERAHNRMTSIGSPEVTDSLIFYTVRINNLARGYVSGDVHQGMLNDFTSINTSRAWYLEYYKPTYVDLSRQITKFMTGAESTLGPDVNSLSLTARRAVTPVFLSLIVMIVVALMFYFFLNHYIIKPIMRIDRSLGEYLRYRTPFDKNIACRDEIASLRDRIMSLIAKLK